MGQDVIPIRIFLVSQLNDCVARLNAGLRSRRTRIDASYHRGAGVYLFGIGVHVQSRNERHRQDHIHKGARDDDNRALPACFGLERSRVIYTLLGTLLTQHPDIAAEQNGRNPEIGIAPAETEQPRSKADAERLNLNANGQSRPEMSQLVDQDHDPQ